MKLLEWFRGPKDDPVKKKAEAAPPKRKLGDGVPIWYYCIHCHADARFNAVFCPRCGQKTFPAAPPPGAQYRSDKP